MPSLSQISRIAFDRVETRRLSKIYGRHRALFGVDLVLERGKVTALLGPNGAGKTTLLSLLSTLSQPTSGTIHFGDLPANLAKEARGQIGLLSHAPLTYSDLSGLENVVFFARLSRVPSPEPKAKQLLTEFGLTDAMHRPAKTYSRGMLQRLGLARALIAEPSLVLLDEPFTGLDPSSTRVVADRIRVLRDQGAMILMISHDLEISSELGDEFVILVRGKIAATHRDRLDAVALRKVYADVAEGLVRPNQTSNLDPATPAEGT